MNNSYDRGEDRPKTHEEMIAAGYTMSGEGFWMPGDELTISADPVTTTEEPAVRLFLLKSGETIISEYEVSMSAKTYFFRDPRIVMIQSSSSSGGEVNTTVAYSDWMPLSSSRSFTVSSDWIVTSSPALDSLVESYLNNKNNNG